MESIENGNTGVITSDGTPVYPGDQIQTRYVEVPTRYQDYNDPVDWKYFADGIQAGSWAVLLFLAMGFVVTRKSLGGYLKGQVELMDALKEKSDTNAETIRLIAQNDQRVSETLESLQKDNQDMQVIIGTWVKKFDQDNKTIIALLKYLARAEQNRSK